VFVTQTLKLLDAEQREKAGEAQEAPEVGLVEEEQDAGETEEVVNMFSQEGWVKDPFMARGSAAMAVMLQQTLLVRLVRERCLASPSS
jgi:hypothetical protein